MVRLHTPLRDEDILSLKLGDIVFVNGIIYTGTDKIHRYLARGQSKIEELPFNMTGGIIYHCSPILKKVESGYTVISAGPITSTFNDLYQGDVIKNLSIKAIIGKGGMEKSTIKAMRENKCVYLSAIGGTGVYLANRVKKVLGNWSSDEFYESESMWVFEVEDFPTIVTIDAHQFSLHDNIKSISAANIIDLLG
ncbi:MAG: fumarate hydratase C-terminal domain-containing protein [Thermodesulfovibrionales bacterium]|nr:fumarate hydratase C-terminal domain-containing protein [Thermodesulfovibrionales bacterium]